MFELVLDDTYKIVTDKHNIILQKNEEILERGTKEPTGRFQWKDMGFFNTLKIALMRYVIEVVKEQDTTDVHKLIDKLDSVEKHIEKVVKKSNVKLLDKKTDKDE